MKKTWCENHNCSECTIVGTTVPSLAKVESRVNQLQPESRVITDKNAIINFLSMYDNYQAGMDIPKEIVVRIPNQETVEYLSCTASNSKNKQRRCSHFQ